MRIHFTDKELVKPRHPVTVNLIGCGGTGSQVLTCLSRIDAALRGTEHPGLHVTAYDPDVVTASNIGRQLFSPADIGQNKAVCLVTRINRFFGLGWQAERHKYNGGQANILITCTDNIASRLQVHETIKSWGDAGQPYEKIRYWMDFGNTQDTGQVVLGSQPIAQPASRKFEPVGKLPFATELFDYSALRDEDSGPSCSLAEALDKQDLFINSTLAQLGSDLLWKLLHNAMIEHQGLCLSLDMMKVNPIGV